MDSVMPECLSGSFLPLPPVQSRIQSEVLCAVKDQDVLLSHAGRRDTPDGTASELTSV